MILFEDTETGGRDPNKHSILEVSLGSFPTATDRLTTYVKEKEFVCEPQALTVNNIDLSDIAEIDGICPRSVVTKIDSFVKGLGLAQDDRVFLCGWNTDFDYRFIQRLYRLADQETLFGDTFSYRVIDLCSAAQFLKLTGARGGLPEWISSHNMFEHFDVYREANLMTNANASHRAEYDMVCASVLFERMRGLIG